MAGTSRCWSARSSSGSTATRSCCRPTPTTRRARSAAVCSTSCATQPCDDAAVNDALERFARDFPAGTVLFEEGQPGHVMYIVVAGEIEIRRRIGQTERTLAVLAAGEFFGEMAILSGRPRSAIAVARTAARLLVIDGTTFEAMLRARPEIALRLIKALAGRLDATNHHVELLLLPTANHRVVQCLRHMAEEQLAIAASQPLAPHVAGTAAVLPLRT